jgi:hypothetical protein
VLLAVKALLPGGPISKKNMTLISLLKYSSRLERSLDKKKAKIWLKVDKYCGLVVISGLE